MEDLKFTTKIQEDYHALTIRNSAFDDIQNEIAEISFTLEMESYKNGITIRFKSLDSLKLNYEGLFEEQDKWTPVEDIITADNINEWKINSDAYKNRDDISSTASSQLLLKEIYIDVIKKQIDLSF